MPEIHLKSGDVALIDDCDAELLNYRWFQQQRPRAYVFRTYSEKGKGRSEFLHRAVMARVAGRPLDKKEEVDHISGDHLDNRRSNLRLATRAQNMINSGLRRNNTSGYKGVSWSKAARKWIAQYHKDGQVTHLGFFLTREAAHAAYCAAIAEAFGEYAPPHIRTIAETVPDWHELTYEYVSPFNQRARDAGLPLADFLLNTLNECGTIAAASRKLDLHPQTIWRWMYKLGIGRRTAYDRNAGFEIHNDNSASQEHLHVSTPATAFGELEANPI